MSVIGVPRILKMRKNKELYPSKDSELKVQGNAIQFNNSSYIVYDAFGNELCTAYQDNTYLSAVAKCNSINIEGYLDDASVLMPFHNVSVLDIDLSVSNKNISLLNCVLENNVKTLKTLKLNLKFSCNDNKVLSLSALKASNMLTCVDINAGGVKVSGIKDLPDSVKLLSINCKSDEAIDLAKLPISAEFICLETTDVCYKSTDRVYNNLKAIGIKGSNIDDYMLKEFSNAIPNVESICLEKSDNITDISSLKNLKSLNIIFANDTSIEDAEQFKDGFNQLEQLMLSNTYISSLKPLYEAKLPKLTIVTANPSCKFFRDEILDFKEIKAKQLFVLVGSSINNFEYTNIEGDTELTKYVNDRFIKNGGNYYYSHGKYNVKWENMLVTEIDDGSYHRFNKSERRNAEHNLSNYTNLEKITCNYSNSKSLLTLNSKLKSLELKAEISKLTERIFACKSDYFTELETLSILRSFESGDKINLNTISMCRKLKHLYIASDLIEGGKLPSLPELENLVLDARVMAEVEINLDEMPNLKSIKLNRIKPKFILTKPHKNLKYVSVKNADIFSVDEMFGASDTVPEKLLSPEILDLSCNNITDMNSNVISYDNAIRVDMEDNILNDDGVILTASMRDVALNRNLLSKMKLDEVEKHLGLDSNI